MEEIQTYQQINKKDVSIHFDIKEMNSYSLVPDKNLPHRHDFYTVIITIEAKGKHIIDFNEYPLEDNQVFFVSPGQVHQVLEDKTPKGFALLFSEEFLINNNISNLFIDNLNLFNDYGDSPPLPLNQKIMGKLLTYCNEMKDLHSGNFKFKNDAIGSYLKLFLIECNNLISIDGNHNRTLEKKSLILIKFKDAVDKNYNKLHYSSDYANLLHISPDHLNRVIKSLTGKTSKEYIHSRINIASKRLLYFSDLSTKEIGFKLGFSEASNFSTFFKKINKITPSEFRENQ